MKTRSAKRVITSMTTSINMAKFVTCSKLLEHFGGRSAPSEIEKENRIKKAAAVTNYFFGEPTNPMHIGRFDFPALYDEGYRWLGENPFFMELIIQSLRVRGVIECMRSGKTQIFV